MSQTQTQSESGSQVAQLTSFQKDIMLVLAEEEQYGLAIKRELEQRRGKEVNHGRLYPNLDDLVETGFVGKSERDKRTNNYTLTFEGYEALVEDFKWAISKFVIDHDRAQDLYDMVDEEKPESL